MGSTPEFIALLEQISSGKPIDAMQKMNRLIDLELKPGDEAAARNCRAVLLYEKAHFIQPRSTFQGHTSHENTDTRLQSRLHPKLHPLFVRALDDMEVAIKKDANNATYYCNRARLKLCFHKYESAFDDVNSALDLRPNLPNALTLKCDILLCLNDEPSAMECLSRLVRYRPNSESFATRASRFAIIGKLDKAIEDFNVAIALCPHSSSAYAGPCSQESQQPCMKCGALYVKRANLHLLQGHLKRSEADVSCALQNGDAQSKSRALRIKASVIRKRQQNNNADLDGNSDVVESLYNAALMSDEKYVHGLCERATFLMEKSRFSDALKDWQRVALLWPGDSRIRKAIRFCEKLCPGIADPGDQLESP